MSKNSKEGKTTLLLSEAGREIFPGKTIEIEMSYVMAKRIYFDRNPDMEIVVRGKRIVIDKLLVAGIHEE